jgi:hypothetical protein
MRRAELHYRQGPCPQCPDPEGFRGLPSLLSSSWVPGALISEIKGPEHESHHSRPSTAYGYTKWRNSWTILQHQDERYTRVGGKQVRVAISGQSRASMGSCTPEQPQMQAGTGRTTGVWVHIAAHICSGQHVYNLYSNDSPVRLEFGSELLWLSSALPSMNVHRMYR